MCQNNKKNISENAIYKDIFFHLNYPAIVIYRGKTIHINYQAQQLFSFSGNDIEHISLSGLNDHITISEGQDLQEILARIDKSRTKELTVQIYSLKGESYQMSVQSLPQKEDTIILLFNKDRNQHKLFKIKNELEEIKSDITAIMNSIEQAFFVINTDYTLKILNKITNQRILNYYNKKISLGDSILDHITPHRINTYKKCFQNACKGIRSKMEEIVHTNTGEINWVQFDITPIYASDGKLVAISHITSDITEQKRAEYDLQYRLNFEQLITELSNQFINMPTDNIDNGINQALQEITLFFEINHGYIYQLDDNNKFMVRTHEGNVPYTENNTVKQQQVPVKNYEWLTEKLQSQGYAFINNVGSVYKQYGLKQDMFPNKNAKSIMTIALTIQNRLFGFLGFDSTEKHKTWTDNIILLLKTAGEIFTNALERKRIEYELTNAKKDAEIAYKTKSNFLANMSHEIRTPLNSILGFIQLFEYQYADQLNNDQVHYLNTIKKNSDYLLEMINDILDLTHIETQRIIINKKPFDINEFLSRSPSLIKTFILQKKLKMVNNIQPNMGLILADEIRIKQIIFNLLSNAVKYSEPGKKFGIEAYASEKDVVIIIWDEGKGIAPEDHERIFQPFEQIPDDNLSLQGTGLGLAIVKQLVEMHKGTIKLESNIGEGSRFIITLPGRIIDQKEKNDPLNDRSANIKKIPPKKILAVDDNSDNLTMISDMLKLLNCQTELARSGEEAIKLCEQKNFDLILMDIKMPGIGGIKAMKQIKKQKPGIHVIALTAYAMKDDRERLLNEGFDEYISKPVNLDQMIKIVNKYI